MIFKKGLLVFISSVVFYACETKDSGIQYEISHLLKDSIPLVKINMRFPADANGMTILEFPNDAWGQNELHNSLYAMQMVNFEGTIQKNSDSGWIVLKYPKKIKELEFEYQLKQDFEDDVSSRKIYRPIITPEYFHIFSHNMFMVPKNMGPELSITLNWLDMDNRYTIHNSFGSQERQQHMEKIKKEEFGSAIFVGGDFRVLRDSIKGNTISLATRGDWVPFQEEAVLVVLKQTLTCQRNFWNDHTQEYFTVIMQPFPQNDGSSFQGTGLTNSFATSVSNNRFTSMDQIVYLFNHELMHNWIGHTIKNDNEEEQYWFSEGFTEYYTFKNISRNNINGLDGNFYINEINRTIRELFSSPVVEVPNSEINYDNFWTNFDYSKLPYYRGAIFAFCLDQKIKQRSEGQVSLDTVMQKIFSDASRLGQKMNHGYFVQQITPYWGRGFEDFFEKHIIEGKKINLAKLFDELELDYVPESNMYHLGFQFAEDKKTIVNVDSEGNAWKAGLRNGDEMVSQSIWYGQMDHKVNLGITRKGTFLKIEYFPTKKARVPQLQLTQNNLKLFGF
ncbi:M1 family aminopeptidase [Flagellimonas meishanensis]|uniref:M1 family aminopeptidase n=1 Tax=Flagellimonas meishanensis TaxID=2873264 RepID=UPI001CA68213|nr:M1 family aminopeptidase [[Muricauda] meishanensis]